MSRSLVIERLAHRRPSFAVFGGGEDARVVAADLAPLCRRFFAEVPTEGDFPQHGLIRLAYRLESALRRGYIERCGYHRDGQWQYRLTPYGAAIARATREMARRDG